jgi:DNA replication protein DnaC
MVDVRQFWKTLAEREWGLYAVVGRPGTGKTTLSLTLASFINDHHRAPAYVIGIEQWKLDYLAFPAQEWTDTDEEKLLEKIASLERTPGPKILVIDDASLWFGIDSYSRPSAHALRNLINVRRHHQLTLILNCQESAGLHKHLMKPDVLFLKPMSMLYQDIERPFIKRMQEEAMAYFSQMPSHEWKEWAFAASDDPPFRGVVRYGKPPGWEDHFSTSTRPRAAP